MRIDLRRWLPVYCACSLLLIGSAGAEIPEISDPELRLPEDTAPGIYPTAITATNVDVVPIPGSIFNGNGSNNLLVSFPASGPVKWTESRHNEGDIALLIGPADPNDPSYYPPPTFVDDYKPIENGPVANTTIAWRVSRDVGAMFASVRHNGVDNQDTANGQPLGITHGIAYFNADLGQGWGFRMNDGVFANGGSSSADLQMGIAGNDGGAGEASFSTAAVFLPYEQGWQGAWVNTVGFDEIATFGHASPGLSDSVASWIPVDGEDVTLGAIGRVELPGVNSAVDGMLFVAPTSGNNSSNIAAGAPRDGGWDIAVREDNDSDLTGQTIGVGEAGYQFLYVPYDSTGLIGGHVNGTDGSLLQAAGSNRVALTRQGAGQYAISVTDAGGNKRSESDGMLMLSVAGLLDGPGSVPDRSFLSYQYDPASGDFIVQARQLTAVNTPAQSQNIFGDVLSLKDTDFYFAYVDFANPFAPPGTAAPGDFDGDGQITATDIDLLNEAIRTGETAPQYDLNQDSIVDANDRYSLVEELANTYVGDANFDGEFSSSDFVFVFQFGQYEDAIAGNSRWETGDWNGDTEFSSGDFVEAFQRGGYELGPRAALAAVPEPTGATLLLIGGLFCARRRKLTV